MVKMLSNPNKNAFQKNAYCPLITVQGVSMIETLDRDPRTEIPPRQKTETPPPPDKDRDHPVERRTPVKT